MNDDEHSSARVSATLIITGDDLEPEIVTRALGELGIDVVINIYPPNK